MKPDSQESSSESHSTSPNSTNLLNNEWKSPIIRTKDGGVVGVTLFFTAEDLELLGIDIRSAEEVLYAITKDQLIRIRDCE